MYLTLSHYVKQPVNELNNDCYEYPLLTFKSILTCRILTARVPSISLNSQYSDEFVLPSFQRKADGNKFLIGHFAHLFDHFDITPQVTTHFKALTKNVSEEMRSEFSPERYLFKAVSYNVGVFHINLKVGRISLIYLMDLRELWV